MELSGSYNQNSQMFVAGGLLLVDYVCVCSLGHGSGGHGCIETRGPRVQYQNHQKTKSKKQKLNDREDIPK